MKARDVGMVVATIIISIGLILWTSIVAFALGGELHWFERNLFDIPGWYAFLVWTSNVITSATFVYGLFGED